MNEVLEARSPTGIQGSVHSSVESGQGLTNSTAGANSSIRAKERYNDDRTKVVYVPGVLDILQHSRMTSYIYNVQAVIAYWQCPWVFHLMSHREWATAQILPEREREKDTSSRFVVGYEILPWQLASADYYCTRGPKHNSKGG